MRYLFYLRQNLIADCRTSVMYGKLIRSLSAIVLLCLVSRVVGTRRRESPSIYTSRGLVRQ